jgi:hypothetical protein
MKLTKSQRHKYYKKALESFLVEPEFLCVILKGFLDTDYCTSMLMYDVQGSFPELLKRKPEGVGMFWWGIQIMHKEGITPRLKVLRACIRETAPNKRKTR